MSERMVPREWQERVLGMMDGWTRPMEILPMDLDRWIALLEDARDAVQPRTHHESAVETWTREGLAGCGDSMSGTRTVVARKHLPTRFRVWPLVTLWLLLDRLGIPSWAWGVFWTLAVLVMGAWISHTLKDSEDEWVPQWDRKA